MERRACCRKGSRERRPRKRDVPRGIKRLDAATNEALVRLRVRVGGHCEVLKKKGVESGTSGIKVVQLLISHTMHNLQFGVTEKMHSGGRYAGSHLLASCFNLV